MLLPSGAATDACIQVVSNIANGKKWSDIDYGSVATSGAIGAVAGPALGKAGKLAASKCKNAFGPAKTGIERNHPIASLEGLKLKTLFHGVLLQLKMENMLIK